MSWVEKIVTAEDVLRFQVYEDKGAGYQEEQSYFVSDAFVTDGYVETKLSVSDDVVMLRLDPVMSSCVVKIKELTFNGEPVNYHNKRLVITNGKLAGDSYVFATQDPNINIKLSDFTKQPDNVLEVKMEVRLLPLAMVQDLAGAVKKLI
jgi:hypothetical protein